MAIEQSLSRRGSALTREGLVAAWGRVGPVALTVAAVGSLIWSLVVPWRRGEFALDFHHELYVQARALLETGVAFDPPDVVIDGSNRIFPPLATLLATPLAVLPPTMADVLMTLLLLVMAAATLRVLDVRDWRVYAVVAVWPPFLSGLQTANVTFAVSLLAALAWRYRGRSWLPGLMIGLAIGLKLFPWPLAVWLFATRRLAAGCVALGVGAASVLLVAPFGSPLDYLRLLRRLGDEMAPNGYSLIALVGPGTTARAIALLVGLVMLAVVVRLRRDDRRSFTVAVLACIFCTPIVWLHYFQLLVVPMAIVRPRLGALWFVPVAMWVLPVGYARQWEIALGLALVIASGVLILVARRISPEGPAAATAGA
jgi:alpha-1,2-mannosyltransferase